MSVKEKAVTSSAMDEIVERYSDELVPFKQGEVVEATIQSISRSKIQVDIGGFAFGFVPEREFTYEGLDLKPGDTILAYVLSVENDDGYVVLSLKRAEKERIWQTLEEKNQSGDFLTVKIVQANKGGLLVRFGEVEGFIPVSQLASQTLGRVADRDRLTTRLNELVGQTLKVKPISLDRAANRLILSEKAVSNVEAEEKIKNLKVGDIIKGSVTGVVDFGLFVDIGNGIEGLVHISEVAWERIDSLNGRYKPGDEVEVQVIDIDGSRVSLSIKRLLPDPWVEAAKNYHEGQIVEGEVTRVTPFGAFVKFDPAIDGLVRIAEITDNAESANSVLAAGQKYPFKILTIDSGSRQIALSYKQAK